MGTAGVETVDVTKDFREDLKKRKDAPVLSGRELDTVGLDEDVQELFRCKDDGTVELYKWISDVQWILFHGEVNVCKDGEPEKEEMPAWTRKAI